MPSLGVSAHLFYRLRARQDAIRADIVLKHRLVVVEMLADVLPTRIDPFDSKVRLNQVTGEIAV
jgi:hypothetical protein